MYIRRVTRKNKNGTTTAYLQLAQNVWDPRTKSAKVKVVYSFGRENEVNRPLLECLVQSIIRRRDSQAVMPDRNAISEQAELLFQSRKQLGGTWLLQQLWRKFGLEFILEKLLADRKHHVYTERLIFSMVANRALHPSSKLAMEDWIREVYLPGITQANSQQLYRAMDILLKVQPELEHQIYCATSNLLDMKEDLGHSQLVDVENAFKSLKATLELRPVFHHSQSRIRAHFLLNWLALLLIRIAELKTGMTWGELRQEMDRIYLDYFSSEIGNVHQSTELTAEQRKIFAAIECEPPPRFFKIDTMT